MRDRFAVGDYVKAIANMYEQLEDQELSKSHLLFAFSISTWFLLQISVPLNFEMFCNLLSMAFVSL